MLMLYISCMIVALVLNVFLVCPLILGYMRHVVLNLFR